MHSHGPASRYIHFPPSWANASQTGVDWSDAANQVAFVHLLHNSYCALRIISIPGIDGGGGGEGL